MKSKKLIFLEKSLKIMAKLVLLKYKPHVIAITGSVGKSSAKESIYGILSKFIFCRKSEKNYNNEVGVPLTIIGYSSENSGLFFWLAIFLKWLKLLIFPSKYPKILVLEMGADRPGDIKYLCEMVPVSVGVLTNIGISHLEYFKSEKAIIAEKAQILKCLPSNGWAVYNYDEKKVRKIGDSIKSNSIGYGFEEHARLRATDLLFVYETVLNSRGIRKKVLKGLSFKVNFQGKIIPVRLNGTISKASVYSTLAAFGVGQYFNLNLIEMVEAAKNQYFLPGRMRLLKGIKRTMIIDDSYNSAPDSLKVALETAGWIREAERKIAVLGDMLELGNMEEESHKKAGAWAAKNDLDVLITVGKRIVLAAKEFSKEKKDGQVFSFDNSQEAGIFLQNFIQENDLVLVKGSQGIRMEKVVEEIMANPKEKRRLLVRQSKKWKKE